MDETFGQSMRRCPCDDFLCGTDYLRAILTPDLPLRWLFSLMQFWGDRSRFSEVSHIFLTTFLIGIQALTQENFKVAAESFLLSDRDFPV